MRGRILVAAGLLALSARATAQSVSTPESTRVPILLAENRRASSPADLARLKTGARSRDPDTARLSVRALGRLERASLVPAIMPALRARLPEVRIEAANALGQALQGTAEPLAVSSVSLALTTQLRLENDPNVRAVIDATIGRLPYTTAAARQRAEQLLVGQLGRSDAVMDRLGVAKGLEALARISRPLGSLAPETVTALRALTVPEPADEAAAPFVATAGAERSGGSARVRRLALEALISAAAADERTITQTAADPDVQLRQLSMRAAKRPGIGAWAPAMLERGLADPSPTVRFAALEALGTLDAPGACTASLMAASDADLHVALLALDQLRACGGWEEAVRLLERTVNDLSDAGSPRGWHRAAHALRALAVAAPTRGSAALEQFVISSNWHLRVYAARAAEALGDRATLERLAGDRDDNVREAAIIGLSAVVGHAADELYLLALSRPGHQAVRAAAQALAGTPDRVGATRALRTALDRLVAAGEDSSRDARLALAKTLGSLGVTVSAEPTLPPGRRPPPAAAVDAAELRRLASPRARLTIRGVGVVELALIPSEAPASVVRFVRLAESGYYNGLTFHRVVPTTVVQGGSPGASDFVGAASHMRDEVGIWPHVRGAVGIAARGRDAGDAQIFINVADNPQFDHTYTVFAQVLNGVDVVDAILEGDVIDTIDILTGP